MLLRKAFLVSVSLFATCLITSCGRGTDRDSNSANGTPVATPTPISTPTPSPTPKPTPHPAAVDALKSLRKMAGVTKTKGINLQEYSARVVDLKSEVDASLSQLPEGLGKREIKLALQAYIDAKTIWDDAATDEYVVTTLEPAKSLRRKYKIPEIKEGQAALKKIALSTIWAAANRHIASASYLLNE